MSHLTEGDDVLHHADGRHLALPPEGTADPAGWIRRLHRHLAGHRARRAATMRSRDDGPGVTNQGPESCSRSENLMHLYPVFVLPTPP